MNSVQRLMFIAGLYYFLQGMSGNPGLHRQALNFYLTQHMGFGAADLAYFTFLITIPWMVKPVYGIIADSLPLFGYRMKSYFILGSLFASLSYLTIFWFDLSNVSSLYLLFILPAVGIASSDVLCDKWMLVTGKPLNVTDRLQSAQWFSISLAGIIMVSISCGGFADWGFGALRDRHVPLNIIFGVFAGIALVSVVIVLLIKPRETLAQQDEASNR